MKGVREGIWKTMDRRKRAGHNGYREQEERLGFRFAPFVEDGRDPPIPPAPVLIHAHGSHDFNAWQPSHCPMLFLHLVEFKVPRGR
jgi:hypothetical protein